MKRLLVFSLLTLALTAADRPAAKPASQPLKPTAIPADARETAPGLYHYTDQAGKNWLYSRTPFGVVRFEEQPAAAPKDADLAGIRATEDGDAIRFERPGPFGTYRWRRSKSELDEVEKAVWDRERARTAATQD